MARSPDPVPVPGAADDVFGTVTGHDDRFLARALPEAPLAPDLPLIDAHVHLWHRPPDAPYFLPEFGRDVAESGHGVIGSVYVECSSMYRQDGPAHLRPVGETEFAVGQAAMAASGAYGPRATAGAIVGFADLRHDRLDEVLDAHEVAGRGRFRGIRQRAKWDADPAVKGKWSEDAPHLYLDPAFQEGVRRLAARDLLFEASIYHPQLPDVVALARAVPEARIVLVHCGSPVGHHSYRGREAETHADWLAGIRDLADCPNVRIKLGGLLMNLGNYDFTRAARPVTSAELTELWRPWLDPVIEHLGAARCMASSNFPVDKCGFPYGTLWNMFKRLTERATPDERDHLLHDCANMTYRMGLPAAAQARA